MLLRILPFVLLTLLTGSAHGQLSTFEDLEATTDKGFFRERINELWRGFKDFGDPFALNGGVALDLRSYAAKGAPARQDPFFYALSANVNAKVYKLNLPVSLTITAKNSSSSYPNFGELADAFRDRLQAQRDRFVRFGVSPHYKWVRGHFGHRTMTFSQFTLANLNFLGAGLELTPDGWVAAGMYGRLAKAEPIDLSLVTPNLPQYRRTGWGARFGRQTEDTRLELVLFGASDDATSLDLAPTADARVAPQQNMVVGLNAEHLFYERFRVRVEYAASAVSPDMSHAETSGGGYPDFLFRQRESTEVDHAVDANLIYEGARFNAGVQLLRVDPGYRSFGAYFFNNDVIDVLGNLAFDAIDGKMNVALSAGVEANNLNLTKEATTRRFVYSGDVAYGAGGFTGAVNYTNNTSDIGYVLNPELDSLNAVIIAQNAGITLGYTISDNSNRSHTFATNAYVQQVNDDLEDPMASAFTQLIGGTFSYTFALPSDWRFTARTSYLQNELAQLQINRLGYGGGVATSFLEGKITLSLDGDYFTNTNDLAGESNNLQGGFSGSYQLTEGLSANTGVRLLHTTAEAKDNFTETIVTVGLRQNLNFSPKSQKGEN